MDENFYLEEYEVEKIDEVLNNTCWDPYAGLKGSTFHNCFVLAVFSSFMLSEEIDQDILMERFKIGCYFHDFKGNLSQKISIRNTCYKML